MEAYRFGDYSEVPRSELAGHCCANKGRLRRRRAAVQCRRRSRHKVAGDATETEKRGRVNGCLMTEYVMRRGNLVEAERKRSKRSRGASARAENACRGAVIGHQF